MMSARHEDPTRSFERELRRAERERRQILAASASVALALAIIGVVAAVAIGRAAPPDSEPRRSAKLALEPATPAPDPAAVSAEETAPGIEAPEEKTQPAPETPTSPQAPAATVKPKPELQRFSVGIGQYGYDPEVITAKAGVPIKLTVAQGEGCAAGFLMPSLRVDADNSAGPAVVDLPALEPGSYQFTCGMAMVAGTLVVR